MIQSEDLEKGMAKKMAHSPNLMLNKVFLIIAKC